jgi:hypothetical protein
VQGWLLEFGYRYSGYEDMPQSLQDVTLSIRRHLAGRIPAKGKTQYRPELL